MGRNVAMSIEDSQPVNHGVGAQETTPSLEEMMSCVADTDVTILLQGESGVGKGVTAVQIHQRSSRRAAPFVKVNCAALPEFLLESELFGYERGAFTGADRRKQGQFELANSGTLFLDEIAELSMGLQAKLLHVLQDGTFAPLGSTREIHPDVRVIVATNQDLEELVAAKQFREDLFFRLSVMTLWVPPLRQRPKEIVSLANYFLDLFVEEYGRSEVMLSPQTCQTLLSLSWPGNIRELENAMRRVVLLGNQDVVMKELMAQQRKRALLRPAPAPDKGTDEDMWTVGLKAIAKQAAMNAERHAIQCVLAETGWNRWQAAKKLKVSYKALLYKMQDCGLESKSKKTNGTAPTDTETP